MTKYLSLYLQDLNGQGDARETRLIAKAKRIATAQRSGGKKLPSPTRGRFEKWFDISFTIIVVVLLAALGIVVAAALP
jgi:hypothetical protein